MAGPIPLTSQSVASSDLESSSIEPNFSKIRVAVAGPTLGSDSKTSIRSSCRDRSSAAASGADVFDESTAEAAVIGADVFDESTAEAAVIGAAVPSRITVVIAVWSNSCLPSEATEAAALAALFSLSCEPPGFCLSNQLESSGLSSEFDSRRLLASFVRAPSRACSLRQATIRNRAVSSPS